MASSLPDAVTVVPVFDVPSTASSSDRSDVLSPLSIQPSVGSTKEKDEIISDYLEETGLIAVIDTWIKDLSQKEELPYNPYPEIIRQARSHAERFHMFTRDNSSTYESIRNQVFSVDRYTARTQDSPACWGLASVLHIANTECLKQFDWLVSSMNTDAIIDDLDDYSYIIQKVIPVVVGPCVFIGSLYPDSGQSVNIRMEYGINGPHEHQAAAIFAKLVLADIQKMKEAEVHIITGIVVPTKKKDAGTTEELWTCSGINDKQDHFLASVVSAAVVHKMPFAKCLFRLQSDARVYRTGCKEYNMNFAKTGQDGSSAPLSYISAHEGIFTSHYHVKEYLSWFASVDGHSQAAAVTAGPTGKLTGNSRRNGGSMETPWPSRATTHDASSSGTSEFISSLAGGPYSDNVMSTVKLYFSERIFELGRQNEFFKMLHYIVLVLLFNRESSDFQENIVEACGLFSSTAYQLHVVIQQNIALQDLVDFFYSVGKGSSDVVQTHFLAYRQSMKDLFCNAMKERSSDMLVFGEILLKKLDSITVVSPHLEGKSQTGTLPVTDEVVMGLKVINIYCKTVFLRLLDVAVSNCSHLLKYFPAIKNGTSFVLQQSYKHGAERGDIVNQNKMFLNVGDRARSVSAPSSIARETVILQYLVDSRIDQVFHDCLVDLVTDKPFIPPNPYPRVVSQLCLGATRMELFGDRRSRMLSKLISGSVQFLNPETCICNLPGIEAYGLVSAITALDGKYYNMLRAKIHRISNKVNPRVTVAGYKTLVDVAVSGFGPLYGRVMPYLHQLQLEEHYFVQGPRNSRAEAIHNFTKVVYEHLEDFSEKEDVLFIGFYLGGESFRRSLRDIVSSQRKKAFLTQMLATLKSKQPLYMKEILKYKRCQIGSVDGKVYLKLDWRLVMVRKSFLLHFIDTQTLSYERFYSGSTDPVAFYQNVFSKPDVALLYSRCCGPQDNTDPCKGENLALSLVHVDHYVERAREENLLAVYKWLLFKSLMSQHNSYIIEAWYMLHSAASQLEYLSTLNKTLQNLISEELSRAFRPVLEEDERTSLLDLSLLKTMVSAYSDKLERVLSRGTVMAPTGLLPQLRDKLLLVTSTNSVSHNWNLLISPKTPVILQQINEMLQPLMDAAARNVHIACPEIERALKSVEIDTQRRNPGATKI